MAISPRRTAAMTGVPMVASTLSNDPLEAVAKDTGSGTSFFQLYTPTDIPLAESLVHRAEAAGFKGIVVTLDSWVLGWRPRDLNDANFPQLRGHALANYFSDPRFRALLAKPPEADGAAAAMLWTRIFRKPLTWADLPWLRSLTKLPPSPARAGEGSRLERSSRSSAVRADPATVSEKRPASAPDGPRQARRAEVRIWHDLSRRYPSIPVEAILLGAPLRCRLRPSRGSQAKYCEDCQLKMFHDLLRWILNTPSPGA